MVVVSLLSIVNLQSQGKAPWGRGWSIVVVVIEAVLLIFILDVGRL